MADPAIRAPATRHWQHPGMLSPEGVPAKVMRGDNDGALPSPPQGAAASHRPVIGLAAPAVSQSRS